MARAIHKLTPERVKQKIRTAGMYADGGGLYLCVTERPARDDGKPRPPAAFSWIFRYAFGWKTSANGKRYPAGREMGLGSYPEISLHTAREMAARWRTVRETGKDPIEVREAERVSEKLDAAKALTFKQCAEAFMDSHADGWRNAKHRDQWKATLATYVYPQCGELPVAHIDGALVHKVLDPIWKTKTETASRVRGRIESVLDWAKTRGYRTGENPARWKGHLEHSFPKRSKVRQVKHHAALPYTDLPDFMDALKACEGTGAAALQFTILTAARTGEALGAKWTEIDLQDGLWTIPGDRMKKGREHRVPLSNEAIAMLRQQFKATGGQGYVFPGMKPRSPMSNVAMLNTLERMGRNDLTVHGFRSTFRDWAAEQTNFPRDVCEESLAHSLPDKVEAAYRRGDLFEKRRKLMDAWATFCTTPAKAADVIQMHRKSV